MCDLSNEEKRYIMMFFAANIEKIKQSGHMIKKPKNKRELESAKEMSLQIIMKLQKDVFKT